VLSPGILPGNNTVPAVEAEGVVGGFVRL